VGKYGQDVGSIWRAKEELAMTLYYAARYKDDYGHVLQVCNSIDSLSCEILADPGVRTFERYRVYNMIPHAYYLAHKYDCHHIEINCSRGKGSYKWLKV